MLRTSIRSRPTALTPAAGFTLIELLMVVVVIGIVTGAAIPTFKGYMQAQKLNAGACGRSMNEINGSCGFRSPSAAIGCSRMTEVVAG
jgi:prepilin-type N-terminal cleavage/methylation domain-containing protein